MLRTALLATLLLFSAPLARAQAIGSQIPALELSGLSQTGAKSFADFYGRAVLLEFFAHWCGPCAKSVPHLNELHEKFAARGLSIVGVTSESEEKTLPWVKKHGVEYSYAFDPTAELHHWAGVTSIPYATLIDPQGMVVWNGNPAGLDEQMIERALGGALSPPVWEWPDEAHALAAALGRGDYAAALREAENLHGPIGGLEPAALVRERIATLVKTFERSLERQEYRAAFQLGERLKKELANLPEGERVATRLGELEQDPDVQKLRAGQERLAALEIEAGSARNAKQLEKLRSDLQALAKEFPGTRIERRANGMLADLERVLGRPRPR